MGIQATTDTGDPIFFVTTEEVDRATARTFEAELETARALYRSVARTNGDRQPALVIDLGQVRFLDSRGLQVLLSAHRAARDEGGRIVVRNARGVVQRLLEMTGALDHINGEDTPSRA